ncbi:integral membrane family protein [Rutstroemia sp. NJR-2017a WRK4]|nr:integral membrane family protein [Rutstroemia sp. NJR-2017a WRK4]
MVSTHRVLLSNSKSQILYIVMASFLFVGVQHGMGQHEENLDVDDVVESSKYIWLTILFYINVVTVVKASMTTCLLRLTLGSPYEYILWGALAANFILCFIASFYMIFNCHPIEYAWTQADADVAGYCNYDSADALGYAWAGFSIALYALHVLIPVFLVWNMQMHIKKKFFVVTVLGLGLIAGVAACVRIGVFAADLDYADPLYTISPTLISSVAEAGLGIVAICMATLRPLLRHWRIKGFTECESSPEDGQPRHHDEHKMSTVSRILEKFTGAGAHTVTVINHGSHATIDAPNVIKERKTVQVKTLQRRSTEIQREWEMQTKAGKKPDPDEVNTGGW